MLPIPACKTQVINSESSGSLTQCLRTFYYSSSFSVLYTVMFVACCLSIILNFIIDPDTFGHTFLQFSEVLTNILIVSEILIRIYSRFSYRMCSVSIIVDYFLLFLCIGSTIIFLNEDLSKFVGYSTCDSLFIFRSILYIIRISLMKNISKSSQLESLTIRMYEEDEDVFRRKLELAKIRYKYRPIMGVLNEEDNEESEGEGFIIKL